MTGMSKLTVQLGDKTNQLLEQLATDKSTTKTEIIRRALAMYKYLDDETSDGDKRVSITSVKDGNIIKDIIM
jgi:predicted transcriptional regulator